MSLTDWVETHMKNADPHIILTASSNFSLSWFMDADQASCSDDRRSINRYYTFMGPNLISWSSTKQQVVSRSITESKYHGLANVAVEVLRLCTILHDLRFFYSSLPILICVNISALYLTTNPILHARMKHIRSTIWYYD